MSLWRSLSRLKINVNNFNTYNAQCKKFDKNWFTLQNFKYLGANQYEIHTSSIRQDLMEFFDDENNWSESEVRVGRSWKLEELRIKSNLDLHKLWYVLLKEKNMLLTMEHEYKRQRKGLPNPERLDKVEESMENLESVVRERNQAYYELETGESGERPIEETTNCFGLEYKYKMRQHLVEKRFNKRFLENEKIYKHTTDHAYVKDFLTKLEVKKRRIENSTKRKRYNMACKLLKIFPNLDEEALREQFPDLDIETIKKDKRSRAHQENAY